MPLWSEILGELAGNLREDGYPDFDVVRRKYLGILNWYVNKDALYNRDTILYASAWIQKPNVDGQSTSITDEDLQAFMETSAGLRGPCLDLILHSPGGGIEAAEAIVTYLRSRFQSIRVIIPNLAMSAASMIACAADQIIMGKHSFLGPTDPQVPVATPFGWQYVAANDVLLQFERARRAVSNPSEVAVWQPMLNQYGPDVLQRCQNSIELSKVLVKTWLERYLLKGDAHSASQLADSLTEGVNWGSHARHIGRQSLIDHGVDVVPLENDEVLEDLVLSVFHATTHTMAATKATKIVENHRWRAYIKFEDQSVAPTSLLTT